MKAVVYVIVQSVIAGGEEHKNIHGVYTFKHQAQDRMNEMVVEFEDKQDEQGRCLRGFCPTICESSEADRIALDLAANMHKYGFKYDHIVIE